MVRECWGRWDVSLVGVKVSLANDDWLVEVGWVAFRKG